MSHDVRVVCRPELAVGFQLTGIRVHPASDPASAERVLAALRAEGQAGLVLIEDRLRPPEAVRPGLPLVVPFPGPARAGSGTDQHVIELLRRAIGYRVRLR